MTNYRLTLEAKTDLIEIWNYSEGRCGSAQADRYIEGLEVCFRSMEVLPTHGCAELLPGGSSDLFFYRYQSHYVFFRMVSGTVEILTIIRAARQGIVERFLSEHRSRHPDSL